jgi:PHS family inorganic phosphate transporter-like MFS transporter
LHIDRITVPETPRFTFDVARDIEKADADIKAYIEGQPEGQFDAVQREQTLVISKSRFAQPRSSWSDFYSYFGNWQNGSVLFATMASWFFVDFAFYGLGLNNATVLVVIGYSSGSNVYQALFNNAVGNLILVCAGALPGYWLSVLAVDYIGRKPIQIGGFIMLALIFCIIGFGYNSLNRSTLLALYILAQFFFNFGPNTTTFIIPGECFPTRYRSTCHGLSAASGKLGATIIQLMAPPLLSKGAPAGCQGPACSPWLDHLMEVFALFMLCGTFVSFLVPETKRQTLEVLAGEAPLQKSSSSNSSKIQGGKGQVLPGFGLGLCLWGKKGGRKSQREKKGGYGGNHDDSVPVESVNGDHWMSVASKYGTLRSNGLNKDNVYEEHRAGDVPLQDVGMLLSVLK